MGEINLNPILPNVVLRELEKSEVMVVYDESFTAYERRVNEHLKYGWVILSTSCGTEGINTDGFAIHFYQSILYKETYK